MKSLGIQMKTHKQFLLILIFFFSLSFCLSSKPNDYVKVELGPQAKFIEGLGLSFDFNISKKFFLHLSGGWLVITTDFTLGSGVRLSQNFDSFLRFHRLKLILFPFLGIEGGSSIKYLVEPGFRLRISKWFLFEVGALFWINKTEQTNDKGEKTANRTLKIFPNVVLVFPILKF